MKHSKSFLTYEKYKALLLSTKSIYDAKHEHTKRGVKKTINQNEISPKISLEISPEISPENISGYNFSTFISYGTNLHDVMLDDDNVTYEINKEILIL